MDLIASIILILILISIIIVLLMPAFDKKQKVGFVGSSILFVVLIISIGHSNWNKEVQIRKQLQSEANSGSSRIQKIDSTLKIDFISSKIANTQSGTGIVENVMINGQSYKITAISFEEPIGWTPFQVWSITDIEK